MFCLFDLVFFAFGVFLWVWEGFFGLAFLFGFLLLASVCVFLSFFF